MRVTPYSFDQQKGSQLISGTSCSASDPLVLWYASPPEDLPAGTCFHVVNRAVARLTLFEIHDNKQGQEFAET